MSSRHAERTTLVLGGAGFIGSNLTHRLLERGERVHVFDSLSRPGVEHNLHWLRERHGAARLEFTLGDVRDSAAVRSAVSTADRVFHLAAQVAVTTSLVDPVVDFEVNALGTLHVLEALRAREEPVPLVYTSTNKVYGHLEQVRLRREGQRYVPENPTLREYGVDEARPLDFASPYGCSKGAAEQYVKDYARSFSLPTVVLRMSCIYGPRQFGSEDQGWVAHFLREALAGRPITLYGDGLQVRDALYVEDLVEALERAMAHAPRLAGQAFNLGGGPERATSLLELLERLRKHVPPMPPPHFAHWRTGDQRYFVADTRRFQAATGWAPRVGLEEGLERLLHWLRALPAELKEEEAQVPPQSGQWM